MLVISIGIPSNSHESLSSNKVVNPEKYMVDVSAARAIDVPVPYKSPSYKPLPRQVKWSQLADIHNKALADSGVVTTFRFTAAYEKRRHFAHRQREKKSKKRYKLLMGLSSFDLTCLSWYLERIRTMARCNLIKKRIHKSREKTYLILLSMKMLT